MKNVKSIIYFIAGFAVVFFGKDFLLEKENNFDLRPSTESVQILDGEAQILDAFESMRSGFMVEVSAPVIKILQDDTEGHRHQRFIIRLSNGLTVLVAHNIDLAPRISALRAGDQVTVYGQYEFNEKGGVLHWTHHDPRGQHAEGWILHQGKKYE